MTGASTSAISFARNNAVTNSSIREFVENQRLSQISTAAQGRTLRAADTIIKTYNGDIKSLKIDQQQFLNAVSQSNPALGRYLSGVEAGEASTKRYALSLVGAKVASVGLRAVTMALNMALTSLVSIGISAVFNAISQAINAAKNRMEEANGSINDLGESLKALDDYREKVVKLREELANSSLTLSEATDKRKELYEIQKTLVDKYGEEANGIDVVTGSIEKQIVAIDELNSKKSENWLRDNHKAIEDANKYLNNDYWYGLKNYTEVRPFDEGYRTLGEESNVTNWLKQWFSSNFSESDARMLISGNVPSFYFYGSRKDMATSYDKLYDAVREYLDTEKGLSDKDRKNANAVLNAISSAKQSLINDDYSKHEENYKKATEIVIQTQGIYKTYYKELARLNKEYEDAVVKNDEDAAKKSYQAIVAKYNEIINDGVFADTDNVRGEDIKAYFENQLQDFMNLSVPIRLKVDIEGTKREFRSSYEELIDMYRKVGDKGFEYDFNPKGFYVVGFDDVTLPKAQEFDAIIYAAKEAGVSIESYIDALVQYGKVQKTTAGSSTEALSITKYSEDIKAAQDAISPLLDAYNKLQKGELSNSDIVTLISDKFPSLIQYTNNLSVGIQKLAQEKLEELKTKLDAVDKSKLSESDLKAYEKFIEYIDSLNDGFNSTLAYYEKIQSQTKSVSDSITTLIGLSKEISENGSLSLSSVEKILSDDSLISLRPYLNDVKTMLPIVNGLIEDQKQAYEDLYNEQQRLADPDDYIEASQKKQEEDENALQNSIKRINNQVAKFKEKYGVDLTNWDNLSEDKKKILQNTNAELLSKQNKLINDFEESYNVDLRNFAKAADAKQAVLDKLSGSKAAQNVRDYLNDNTDLGADWAAHTPVSAIPEKIQNEVSKLLGGVMSFEAWQDWQRNGTLSEKAGHDIEEWIEKNFINAFTILPDTWDDATKNIGASGGSGSSSSSKAKTWFEKQYAYHNHLVNMEQETEKSYLNWLDGAYKEAYRQGIIDLDAYYKYEEEVYKGRKKLTGDSVSWFEQQYKQHQHYLKMEQEDDADYLKWLNSAYQQAYKEGLLTLDEYRKYREEVYEGVKRLRDEAESAIKSLIDIRINMLKEDVNKEKEAIDKRLKNLKEFYDKQKELLQDKYDKEKYLDEQAEKRKKVSDVQAQIEALRMDDSAKAQKRRVELTKDLQEAQKDLTDFEKEHTFNEAKDQLDKLYENQEKVLNKQTEALDKKLSSPQELYEQALNDIRNGSQNLYGQMIEWNNLYGDGIRDTIKKAWEEAYKAEKQYFNYTGTHFNGVNLSNATGYVKGVSGYASGTSHAVAGIHKVDEQGVETIFQSADGQRYRMFSSGEKVLNASASDFLYKFANKGREILDKLFNGTSHSYNNVVPGVVANNIQLGDIVIQGNADKSTVSEIRRAQRENLEQMLKQLNRLK